MDSKKIVEFLKNEFAKARFFTRIFEYNDKIYIWNDQDIYLKLEEVGKLIFVNESFSKCCNSLKLNSCT